MNYVLERASNFLKTNTALYVVVLLLALKIAGVFFYIPFPSNLFFADITRIDLTTLLNSKREQLGLNTLKESQKLDQAAALKAQDMVAKGYFAHQSPQGATPWFWFGQAGYTYTYAGENLAVGFIDSPEVFNAWLNSPSHKANMVNPHYTEVGTAVLSGFEGNSVVVVQLFGSPKNGVPVAQKPVSVVPVTPAAPIVQSQPAQATPVQEKVLGSQDVSITNPDGNVSSSAYFKWLNFIIYGNAEYLQYIAYVLLAGIAVCLFINIIAAEDQIHRGLLLRSLVLMLILGISLVMNKDVIMHAIPHQMII
jgi:hypothetical protein